MDERHYQRVVEELKRRAQTPADVLQHEDVTVTELLAAKDRTIAAYEAQIVALERIIALDRDLIAALSGTGRARPASTL